MSITFSAQSSLTKVSAGTNLDTPSSSSLGGVLGGVTKESSDNNKKQSVTRMIVWSNQAPGERGLRDEETTDISG